MRVRRLRDASAFLDRAGAFLMRDEARNNLALGIADRLLRGTQLYDQSPYFATIEDQDTVLGCVLRTPPFKLLVTELPLEAVPALIEDLSNVFPSLPAVLGPEAVATAVAEAWVERHGGRTMTGMRQRIYQLDALTPPARQPPGTLRLATANDLPLVTDWVNAFSDEVHMPTARAGALAEERVVRQELFIWEDGAPRAMAAWAGRTPNAVRIAYVYTPPEYRSLGYATACTAATSQRALDSGYRLCFLFTDLANPVSNSIYQKLGYRPVADVIDRVILSE